MTTPGDSGEGRHAAPERRQWRDEPDPQTVMIAGLATETHKLAGIASDLVATKLRLVKQAALTRLEKAMFGAAAVVMVVLLLFVAFMSLVMVRQLDAARGARARLIDCTDAGDPHASPPRPAGKCYKQGQQTTAAAVKQVTENVSANTSAFLLISLMCGDETTDTAKASCFHAKARLAGLEK